MDTAKKLNDFNTALKEIKSSSAETITAMADTAVDAARGAANEVDRTARRNPWAFMGAAALAAGVLGFFAGRKSKG